MKNLKKFLFIILLLPCVFLLNACSFGNQVYVTDIIETETVGNEKTYTIYYSNGTTSLITIETANSNDEDNENISIYEIYEAYKLNHSDITFEEFLKEYLTINNSTPAVQEATNKALQSCVTIWSEFQTLSNTTSISCGSGIIYKMDEDYSYIVTNYHVAYYKYCNTSNKIANNIHVFQYGTSEHAYKTGEYDKDGYAIVEYGDGAIKAEYIGGALNFDLAVIKVPTSELLKYNPNAKAANIATGYDLGETAIAIGNPECEGFSVTSGIVSVVSEEIDMLGADDYTKCTFRVMRIDTAVNGGNSGGGLFDIDGNLIGIVNAKAIASEIDNIAYAIPFDNVCAVADNIIDYYDDVTKTPATVKKLVLDVTYSIENSRGIYNPETNSTTIKEDIVIQEVTKGQPGHIMGLKPKDIIKSISINGEVYNINRGYELTDLLLTVRKGDKIILTVTRENLTQKLGFATEEGVLETYLEEIR